MSRSSDVMLTMALSVLSKANILINMSLCCLKAFTVALTAATSNSGLLSNSHEKPIKVY